VPSWCHESDARCCNCAEQHDPILRPTGRPRVREGREIKPEKGCRGERFKSRWGRSVGQGNQGRILCTVAAKRLRCRQVALASSAVSSGGRASDQEPCHRRPTRTGERRRDGISHRGSSRCARLPDMKNPWWSSVLRCPRCGGALDAGRHLARCGACGPYPVLGDVPVLVADPSAYCARFHDAILAALAEQGLAERAVVAVVEAFAKGRSEPAQSFGDDWTAHEASGDATPVPVKGSATRALSALLRVAREHGPARWLEGKMRPVKLALEAACGAGERSELLATHAERLLVGDLSLRAVLRARSRASRHESDVAGVVMNAEAPPLKRGTLDLVVAEHVVDLLDEPFAFLERARAALREQGVLLVTTPEPSLGSGDDDALERLAVRAKFRVRERRDGLPWLRMNSSRFVECYLVQALALSPSPRRGRRSGR
jgi:SAM-dependent methyltransferase